jgi:hypothetical protein
VLPDTLLGLVVFSAAAGPGYLYVRLSRTREPRYERTTLEEAAEFVVFGALSSGFAVLLALGFGDASGFLDTKAIGKDATEYTVDEPLRVLAALAFVLALSYSAVWLVTTKLLHRGKATISPGETAWYAAFHRMLPDDHGAYVTVELRDGRALAGLVIAYTPDAHEPREILLSRPVDGSLWVRDKEGNAAELPDAFIVIQGPDILAVSGRYTPEAAGGEPAISAK